MSNIHPSHQLNKTSSDAPQVWVIVPAAGVGKRMTSDIPKQYLSILGKTIIEHTIERLLEVSYVAGVVVCVARNDDHWKSLTISQHKSVQSVQGGIERMHSVYNALTFLQKKELQIKELQSKVTDKQENPFVLVHDAVRPCVLKSDIEKLIDELSLDEVGGLLATPAVDTIKKVNDYGRVVETLPRENCWRAQTPQMFRLNLLQKSIELLLGSGEIANDESEAMEIAGYPAKVIEGSQENIKLTLPSDLALIESILKTQLMDTLKTQHTGEV
jgi:2-C-methyl-D-erythritol 4-phosphate cytidylyltransferase